MFEVRFHRNYLLNRKEYVVIAGPFSVLLPALKARRVSGDLICYVANDKIVDITMYCDPESSFDQFTLKCIQREYDTPQQKKLW